MQEVKLIRTECECCSSSVLEPYSAGTLAVSFSVLSGERVQVTGKEYGVSVKSLKCGYCGLIMPDEIITPEQVASLYCEMEDEDYIRDAELRGKSASARIKKLIGEAGEINSLLEIGSGCGSLLNILSRRISKTEGVEPSVSLAEFSKSRYGLSVHNTDFESFSADINYDAVIALDVIEHCASPYLFLNKIHGFLNEGGLAVIGTPDAGSLTARLLGKRWWHVRPSHLYYFSTRSLEALAGRCGFRVIKRINFSWTFPAHYILASIQKWLFNRIFFNLRFLDFPLKLNTFDSGLFLLAKNQPSSGAK